MRHTKRLAALLLPAALGLATLPAPAIEWTYARKGDQFVVAGVNFPEPFRTPNGQILKAGVYDLSVVSEGADGILIGLLKGGKQVGQLRGIVKALPVDQGVRIQPAGGPGMALPVDQGIKLQPTPRDSKAGSGTDPQNAPKAFHDLGLVPGSRVSFFGGKGKISSTSRSQPAANLPYIEFECPPGPPISK
jgi:hypothetical protein